MDRRSPGTARTLATAAADLFTGTSCHGCGQAGRLVCPACSSLLAPRVVTAWPDPTPAGLAPPWAAGAYAGLVRELLVAHKDRGEWALARVLGPLLAATVGGALTGVGTRIPAGSGRPRVALVPVPSRPGQVRRRGDDPLRRLVATAARTLRGAGVPVVVAPVLRHRGATVDQAGLGADQRRHNLHGALWCPSSGVRRLAGRPGPVIVCDDILTTGATAREAQRALEQAGVPVCAVAVVAATQRWEKGPARRPAPPGRGAVRGSLPSSPGTG